MFQLRSEWSGRSVILPSSINLAGILLGTQARSQGQIEKA